MKKLMITADDYGLSPAVNRAIEECAAKGVVTTTNVMMNMEAAAEGVSLKERFPGLSLGIHFVLTVGKSVSDAACVKTLVDANGCFYPRNEFRKRWKSGQIAKQEIALELQAQYVRYQSLFGAADYWNSHEHVHLGLGLYDLFMAQAAQLGIQKSRCNRKIYAGRFQSRSRSLKWVVRSVVKNKMLDTYFRYKQIKGAPDGIITFLNEADAFDKNLIFTNIQWGRHECGELIIHPAAAKDSPYFGRLLEKRLREYSFFNHEAIKDAARENGILLVGYEAI